MPEDIYDVSQYTDQELYNILDINNPTDRELEAKILSLVNKYNHMGNDTGEKLSQFFVDIYKHFFQEEEEEYVVEGFSSGPQFASKVGIENVNIQDGNVYASTGKTTPYTSGGLDPTLSNVTPINLSDNIATNNPLNAANGQLGNATLGYTNNNLTLTRPLDYSKDNMNPLLTQTIKRVISIDSQYRDNKSTTLTTNFTFNLSEPLKDVVSLKMYSFQIPYTWYTVNSSFGGNVFYIKGNSAGIDNESFYYPIQIPSGNYSAQELINAINYDISTNLITTYTDASFGNTGIAYNTSTGRATLTIDVTKIYGESNYYLQFPPNSTSTTNSTTRFNSISSFMGFNNITYYPSMVQSNFIPGTVATNNSISYNVDACNNVFYIYPYLGDSFLNAQNRTYTGFQSFDPIPITINLSGFQTRETIIAKLKNALISNPYLDATLTNVNIFDVSNADQYGYGSSYIVMNIKLNPMTQPLFKNIKTAVVFPFLPVTSNPLFYNNTRGTSCFQFPNTTIDPLTQNVICETNQIISEATVLQSNYKVIGASLQYNCISTGYDIKENNFEITIPDSTSYTLNTYLSAINSSMASEYITSSYDFSANIYQTTSNDIYIKSLINKTFINEDYTISASGEIGNIFNIHQQTDLSFQHIFDSKPEIKQYSFSDADTLIIHPVSTGNQNASDFVINFASDITYNSISSLVNYLNYTIQNYKDGLGKTPFTRCLVNYTYGNINPLKLTMNIEQTLNQNDYQLVMASTDPSNSWISNLHFDASYILSLSQYQSSAYSIIQNGLAIAGNEIILIDASYNYFDLIPYSHINGLNPPTKDYQIRITIPGSKYSILQLIAVINNQFNTNPLCAGSYAKTVLDTYGGTHMMFYININQVFLTPDFRLVFYDPISFVECFTGATRKGSQTIRNSTWDSTLGWLLGYRSNIIYYLSDYVGNTSSSQPDYYNNNQCILLSDTVVSTNLYNYFLIMLDDYVQNHLNDGLVTLTNQETNIVPPPYIYICDPVTNKQVIVPADYSSRAPPYTAKELYSFNQKVQSIQIQQKSYSSGPFVQDIFGIIPIKGSGLSVGDIYVEFGGSLQNQDRLYFGPVNINRLTIKLLTDRGDLVDLNNADWSFSLVCEQLYKS